MACLSKTSISILNSDFFSEEFKYNSPFPHIEIDNFFSKKIADRLSKDFAPYHDSKWHYYNNTIENKKVINNWSYFPEMTYSVFQYLCSQDFIQLLSDFVGSELIPDFGLHGGGWHIHANGGNLNPHVDYSIHPKLKFQRKLNLIIYLSKELKPNHGAHFGLWSAKKNGNAIDKLEKTIFPQFNRAVIFDTTKNSWHGLSKKLEAPKNIFRKSIAIYYLEEKKEKTKKRYRALFHPRENEKGNKEVLKDIKCR